MPIPLKRNKYRIKKLQNGGAPGDPIMSYEELKKHLGINYLPQATYEKWLESKGVTNLPGAEISTLSDKSYDELSAAEKRIYDLFETPEGTVQTSPVTVKTRGGIPSSLGVMAKFRGGEGYGRNPVAQIKHKGDIHWEDLLDMSKHVGVKNIANYPSRYAKEHPEVYNINEGDPSFRAHARSKVKTIHVPDADYNVPGDFYHEMVNSPDVAQWYKDKITSEGREDQVRQFIAEFSHLMPEHQGKSSTTIKSRELREELEGKYPDNSNYWMRDDGEYQSHFAPEGGEKSLYDKFVTFKGKGEDPNSPEALERKRLYEEFDIYSQGITPSSSGHFGADSKKSSFGYDLYKKKHGGKVKLKKYAKGGKVRLLKKYADGGGVGDPTGAFEDFIYGDWEEVGRSIDDAGVTTIKERRTGERDVEYSKRGVDWNVGYNRWLAAGNKGSLADFKIEAERWKKSQTRKETDVQNRERTIEADKEAEGSKTSGSKESTEESESPAITSEGGEDIRAANRAFVNKWLDDLKAKGSGPGVGTNPEEYGTVEERAVYKDKVKAEEESSPGSGPPPSGSSTYYSHPRVSINNTTNLDTESASTQGKENKLIEILTDSSDIKYPEGGGDDSKTTSVTTRAFKPKIFGEGLRRRGTETSLSEILNPDGTVKSSTYRTDKISNKNGGKIRLLKKFATRRLKLLKGGKIRLLKK